MPLSGSRLHGTACRTQLLRVLTELSRNSKEGERPWILPSRRDTGRRAPGHIWQFADCELDERRRELRVRGVTVDIEAKPLEVLRTLLLHAGEVVTKAELLESVWPGTRWWMARWPPPSRRYGSSWATTTRSSSRCRAWGTSWPCRCTARSAARCRRCRNCTFSPGSQFRGAISGV